MAATPKTPAALATYFVDAAPVGAAEEAAEDWAAELAPVLLVAAELEARLLVIELEAAEDVRDAEVAPVDPPVLEAPLVEAPPGVDEPELVRLWPTQLVSLPLWMGSSLE